MLVRALLEAERSWAAALVTEHFGSETMVSRGALHDTRSLPALIALDAGERCGLLHYHLDGDELEIVVVIACRPRRGVGSRLLEAVREVARARACRRLWLVTTNDNRPALAFYETAGWRCCAIRRAAINEARRLKPQIPRTGHAGIPIEDEIEFEFLIDHLPHATN
jgi:GNAT superfamily N-acetyltransferase